jgi:PEP-CTERM motif-containing protein
MIRSLKIAAVVLIASFASPAFGVVTATTTNVKIVPVDNSAVLTDFSTFDLLLTTPDSDWTSAALLLDLSAGSIYQAALGADGPMPSDFFSFAPDLEFDTYVGVSGVNFAGAAGDFDASIGKIEVSMSRLDVSFYNIDKTDIGTFSIGRITLSNDSVGAWSLISLTADRQRIDLVGTINKGQIVVDAEASAAASLAFYLNSDEYQRTLPRRTYEPDNSTFINPIKPLQPSPELNPESNAILPEPGTVVLLGLGGLALLRRRR